MIRSVLHKFFLYAAILSSCFFFYSCENDEKKIQEWTEKKIMVEEAKDVVSYFSQQGNLRAKLKSPLMLRYQADTTYVEFPKTLHVDFFDSTRKIESWLDAGYGKYLENQNKVLLKDNVVVVNVRGDTLQTSELWWDQQQRKFYTDKEVRITQKDKRIVGGKGMEAGQDMSWYIIKRPTGTVLMEDEMMPR